MILSMIKQSVGKVKARFEEWRALVSGDFQPTLSTPSSGHDLAKDFNPTKDCAVYNTVGCSHIDSVLCGYKCELLDDYELSRAAKSALANSCGNCKGCVCAKNGGTTNPQP